MEIYTDKKYCEDKNFIKNVNEVSILFDLIDDFNLDSKDILDLCCGNFYYQERYSKYNITCSDIKLFNITKRFLNINKIKFIQQDIFGEILKEFKDTLQNADVISAIHPCNDLFHKIYELWNKFSKCNSILILVPCCVKKYLKDSTYKEMKKRIPKSNRSQIHKLLLIEEYEKKNNFIKKIKIGNDYYIIFKK